MLWIVEQRKLWGDLGSILLAGRARREEKGGPLLLERTGPFLPPLSIPWFGPEGGRVVVSNSLRLHLEGAGFAGLRFGPVVYSRVVRRNWHQWDLSADVPAEYPKWGGPSDYIDDLPHDSLTAAAMPVAWELLGPVFPLLMLKVESPQGGYLDEYRMEGSPAGHPDLFLDRATYGDLVVGKAGRDFLARHAAEWVRFCNVVPGEVAGAATDTGQVGDQGNRSL